VTSRPIRRGRGSWRTSVAMTARSAQDIRGLSAQHRELVAQHQDLDVPVRRGPGKQNHPAIPSGSQSQTPPNRSCPTNAWANLQVRTQVEFRAPTGSGPLGQTRPRCDRRIHLRPGLDWARRVWAAPDHVSPRLPHPSQALVAKSRFVDCIRRLHSSLHPALPSDRGRELSPGTARHHGYWPMTARHFRSPIDRH
jgi:hypothetical protein